MAIDIVDTSRQMFCRAWARDIAPKLEAIAHRTPYEQQMILADEMEKALKMYCDGLEQLANNAQKLASDVLAHNIMPIFHRPLPKSGT